MPEHDDETAEHTFTAYSDAQGDTVDAGDDVGNVRAVPLEVDRVGVRDLGVFGQSSPHEVVARRPLRRSGRVRRAWCSGIGRAGAVGRLVRLGVPGPPRAAWV